MPKGLVFGDTILFVTTGGLLLFGLLAFFSSSLGVAAREYGSVSDLVANQLFFGLGLGLLAFVVCSVVPYKMWRSLSIYVYGAALVLTAFVFLPGFGIEHGGSYRWLDLGFVSFQPSEMLKIGLIMVLAMYFASYKDQLSRFEYGVGGFLLFISAPTALLLLQPDHGTLGVMLITAGVMFIAANAPLKHIVLLFVAGLLIAVSAVLFQPYVRDRVLTFIDPTRDPKGASYQVQQSLLALGSGEITGRGLGRGIQKFQYLPEPVGDSIFAVVGEEFGFIGTSAMVALFLVFFLRGFSIATRAPDYFGGLLAIGIVTYITTQSFLNMASMLGLVPLTGIPLMFMSQGGTAMFVALGSVGILMNISRCAKKR